MPPVPTDPRVAELTQKYRDLDRQIVNLVQEGRKTKDTAEKAKLRQQVQELASRQFDLRQEVRELEVERLRKQLADVEQTIRRQKGLKEKILQRRVTDLLDETTELKWEPLAGVGVVKDVVLEIGGQRVRNIVYESGEEVWVMPGGHIGRMLSIPPSGATRPVTTTHAPGALPPLLAAPSQKQN
jgi:hypothetical protein